MDPRKRNYWTRRVASVASAICLTAMGLTVGIPAPGVSAEGNRYSYADIVRRTYDMKVVAGEPRQGERAGQFSSTDPASVYNEETGKYENWNANRDNQNYLYKQDNGYKVLAEMEGPGYISRMWLPYAFSGRVQIFIDGEETPTIDMPYNQLICGSAFSEYGALSFQTNKVAISGFDPNYHGGFDLYVPITYNKSCKVVTDCSGDLYYIIGYTTLEQGASVESFTYPLSDANKAALKAANDRLSDTSLPAGDVRFSESVAPGETAVLYQDSASGAIESMQVKLDIPADQFDDQTSLADWQLSVFWDGSDQPAIEMPLGDFFGTPYGLTVNDSYIVGVREDGTMYCRWYMPYESARVELTNNSASARTVTASFGTEALDSTDGLMRFHSNWQRMIPRTDDRAPDAQMLSVTGTGRYVGTVLHVYQYIDDIWWGEGDEKFFVDGEKFPSIFGTGSEDYFGYAWCGSSLFNTPFIGQSRCDGSPSTGDRQVQGHGNKVDYRFHMTDNVPFFTSLEANMEKYLSEDVDAYAAITFFYLTPDTSENHAAEAPAREDRLFNVDRISGPSLEYLSFYLNSRFIRTDSSALPWLQGMGEFGDDWHGNLQLFWQNTSQNRYVEYLLSVPEGDNYDVVVSLTGAPDYGIYEFLLDGKPVGRADGYTSGVTLNEVSLGTAFLSEGEHILQIRCVGKNPRASRYYFGLNSLTLEPKNEIKTFYEGTTDLLAAFESATGDEVPADQNLEVFMDENNQWNNGGHMWWKPAVGDEANFTLTMPAAGRYSLLVSYTAAGDFGTYDLYLDGEKVGQTIDAYGSGVTLRKVTFDGIELSAGEHTLTLVSTGKNEASSGTIIGIDFLSFTRDPALETARTAAKAALDDAAGTVDCTKEQAGRIRAAAAQTKMAMNACTAEAPLTVLLDEAKAEMEEIRNTDYGDETLLDDLFFEGTSLHTLLIDCTSNERPVDQNLDIFVNEDNQWSNNGHMQWRASKAGDTSTYRLSVSQAGGYDLEFSYTKASDFGQFAVYLDDVKLGVIDGYGEGVTVAKANLGRVVLSRGDHVLKLVVEGKNDASSGYLVGVDYLMFRALDPVTQAKLSAAAELDGYKSAADYTEAQWALVEQAVAAGKAAIEQATTAAAVAQALSDAKAAIDLIETGKTPTIATTTQPAVTTTTASGETTVTGGTTDKADGRPSPSTGGSARVGAAVAALLGSLGMLGWGWKKRQA